MNLPQLIHIQMKKILFIFSALLLNSLCLAQIPHNYYATATGKGYVLKTQLYNIIKVQNTGSYGQLWTLYINNPQAFNDNWFDTNGNNTIMDIYSENINAADAYNYTPGVDQCGSTYTKEGDCYNREHLIPQSSFNQGVPMRNDPFHVWPVDAFVNGQRQRYGFGVVKSANWTSLNGSKVGFNNNSGYSQGYAGIVFEPIDEFKGDIARAHLYFATRYEGNGIQNYNYVMFNGTKDQVFTNTFLRIMLTWHQMDPVSPREIAINETIYEYQGNRNPFIDHPEWAMKIWEGVLGNENFPYQKQQNVKIYQQQNSIIIFSNNPSKTIEKINIYTINGQLIIQHLNKPKENPIRIVLKSPGAYIIKALGPQLEVNKKLIIH